MRLPFIPPYDWSSMMAFLGARAIPGVETVAGDVYRRTTETGGLEVRWIADERCLDVRLHATPRRHSVLDRVRCLFDVDSDPAAVSQHLARDPRLAPLVRKHPGLRLPGAWDPFELAVRAILGQQVSVKGASTLAGRLARRWGEPAAIDVAGLTHTFPSAARLAGVDLCPIGLPAARAAAIRNLARAVSERSLVLDGTRGLDATVAALLAMPGIGPWTAQYIAMRAFRDADALPAGDLGVRNALARNGNRPGRADVVRLAEQWRPYRAYAVMYLWRSLG
jgi:3-methyladenine DNA glycosylase/8-oxoguanine DNA glycosylase